MKVNDIITVEASESLGTSACNGRVLEITELKAEYNNGMLVALVECDDDLGVGYVTATAPHRIVDDMGFILT